MSATTSRTQPSGARVPSAADHAEHLAGAAACSREALYAAANVLTEQADTIAELRRQLARRDDEIAGLKRHIVAMARGE